MAKITALLGIDIHCHILPSVDDGPRTLTESLEMSRKSALEGLGIVVATPHYACHSPSYDLNTIETEFQSLFDALKREVTTIKLLPGTEVLMDPELLKFSEDELKRLSINHTRYILVEMPAVDVPRYIDDFIYNILLKGFIPIIAHPERNTAIIDEPPLIYEIIEQGALTQINAGSITGRFGKDVQKTAMLFLKHNAVHFVATDAHSSRKRAPSMSESFSAIAHIFSPEYAHRLWIDNPAAAITDRLIDADSPIPFRRKWFGGWN